MFMVMHETAKVKNTSPALGGDWQVISPLSTKQVKSNNNKQVVTNKRASSQYIPVMG